MILIDIIKSIILGIVEGITEWLPVSSTGHMILVNEFIDNSGFTSSDLYLYVIQFGAILAVVTLFFKKLNPNTVVFYMNGYLLIVLTVSEFCVTLKVFLHRLARNPVAKFHYKSVGI